jgi:copper(I)-binding protein
MLNGIMMMRPIDSGLVIPAGEAITLRPVVIPARSNEPIFVAPPI